MTVAILMPTHNRADTIVDAIMSCIDQREAGWELYVLDDGSTDGTRDVVGEWHDPRIHYRWMPKHPGNEAGARNALLKWWDVYTAPLACWLDSDDAMHPDRIAVQQAYMEDHPDIDLCVCPLGSFRPDEVESVREGYFMEPYFKADPSLYTADLATFKGNMCNPTAMFRPTVRAVPYDERMVHGGCDFLWMYTLVQQGYRMGAVDRQLYYLREHPDRLTRRRAAIDRDLVRADLDHFYAEITRMGGTP